MALEKNYEMMWDCQFCGTEKLLGKTHRHCPICGAAQEPDARYFPPDDEKVAVEDHKLVGRDVRCPACNSLNSASAVHCGACGAPLEGGEKAQAIAQGDWLEKDADSPYDQSRDVAQEKFERDMAAAGVELPGQQSERESGGRRWLIIAGVVLLAVCGVGFWLFSQTEEQAVIASEHEWTRTINVETYQRTQDGDWRNSVPAAAYNERCYEKQRGTERIADGEECRTVRRDNGDGTFTERQECETTYREEPTYDTWCDYSIDRWTASEAIRTSGTGLQPAPAWGETDFSCSGPRLGCEREAERNESYTVVFQGDDETFQCDFDQAEWAAISLESRWLLEVRQFGGGAACDTLQPQ